ncbi:hypothetical protein EAH74_32950 [Pseudomonas mandelii]|uniref:Uncharacterized protein n=1 Tax=Pseudomonas mandelii TaxID=75612 RepID=A0A502HDF8_9PSED|nr:hypothetical protein EAH74_32950 [Pseudomonas mandelii]
MAQQSLVTSLISRGVTCDADNLVDYQSDSTSTHTNCLIQLLKSGWLRTKIRTSGQLRSLTTSSLNRPSFRKC